LRTTKRRHPLIEWDFIFVHYKNEDIWLMHQFSESAPSHKPILNGKKDSKVHKKMS
jgi:hypothetical protein